MAGNIMEGESAYFVTFNSKSKGKSMPLQSWTGPEGSRRLRLPDFKIIGT